MYSLEFIKVYSLFIKKGYLPSKFIEQILEINDDFRLIEDDLRDEILSVKIIFGEGGGQVKKIFRYIKAIISNLSYEESKIHIEALVFLQLLIATALWKYHLEVDNELVIFAKDFDRLDLESEKIRLYKSIKQPRVQSE